MSVQSREKSYFQEKNSEFRVIVYCHTLKTTMTRNSESLIFYGIAKILIDPVGFGRNETNLDYEMKNFRVIVFQYSAKKTITRNSEFSLPGMIPYVKVKFRVIVYGTGQKR